MKRLVLSARSGSVTVEDVPTPTPGPGHVLVQVAASVVSAGTERMAVEFARSSLLQKAQSRPDLARQVLDKARRDGLSTALQAAGSRLAQPQDLGYSAAGTVIAVGDGVTDFRPGEPVACAGSGYAVHAEAVVVPSSLVVRVPEPIDLESAAFVALGATALHGVRTAEAKLGEVIAVVGLGLVGQLAVQLLKAGGCRVVGMDPRSERSERAHDLGADAVATDADGLAAEVDRLTSSRGADATLITADTADSAPVRVAGEVTRDKGVVVVVGAVGMQVPRRAYYEKELVLRVSRSYGPGRYDPSYEEKGHDYPIGYVRWTERRNMEAFLQLQAEGKVQVKPLITHRFPIGEAPEAYDLILDKGGEPFLGVLLTYPEHPELLRRIDLAAPAPSVERQAATSCAVGLLGAGNFATATLLPAMKRVAGVELVGVCTASGLSARHAAERFGFAYATTDEGEVLNDPGINTVVIATRHHLHARQVVAALGARKHVFCEKPLALHHEELRSVVEALPDASSSLLSVGYNRRFARMARQLKAFLGTDRQPLLMHYRINAEHLPPQHWVHDPEQGGGRIIGEVCHFVDFLTFLAGSLPVRVYARALPNGGQHRNDNVVITLDFADGSLGTISYLANGDPAFAKERVEVFGGGSVAVLDDFHTMELLRGGHKQVHRSRLRSDKGHGGEWEAFAAAVREAGPSPIPFEEIVATTLTTLSVVDSLRSGLPVQIDTHGFMTSARGDSSQAGGGPSVASR